MRIEVYLTTAMEVSHFAPIVRALNELGQDAAFISPQASPKTTLFGWDDADRTDLLLDRTGLPWTKFPDFNADCVLTIQSSGFVAEYKNTKMRMTYGVGLVPPAVITNSGSPFDYHLVHGPFNQRVQFRYHALMSPMLSDDRVKVIGYPRFDDWFKGGDAHKPTRRSELPDNAKPVLLWLPTWGRASSIDRYADAIFALSDQYDIWVKPHHGTVHWERERMTRLANGPCRIVDFTDPPEPSFAAASIVLADLASGAFGEALFLKKRTVALATPDEVAQLLLDKVPFPICTAPSAKMLEGYMMDTHFIGFEDVRAELVNSTEGADGMRAARIVVECLNG